MLRGPCALRIRTLAGKVRRNSFLAPMKDSMLISPRRHWGPHAIASVSLWLGCGHNPPAPPPPCEGAAPVTIRFESAARLNRGEKGESLATTLRIFSLKSETKFSDATFDDLLDRPAESLGDSLLATDEFAIFPKSTAARIIPRAPESTFIGVVAFFREPSGSFWRAQRSLPVPDPDHCRKPALPPFVVQLEDNRIELR